MSVHVSIREWLDLWIDQRTILIAALVLSTLVLISCRANVDTIIESPTAVPTETQIPERNILPTGTPASTLVSDSAIRHLHDVKNALVWVESEGPFYDFEFGQIQNVFGHGAGFIIDPNGFVITDSRIVGGAEKIRVYLDGPSGDFFDADLVAYSECEDTALLKIDGSGLEYLGFELGQDNANAGQVLYITGFSSDGGDISQKKAVVIDELPGGSEEHQILSEAFYYDTEIGDINSGSPVVNPWGRVLGMHQSGYISDRPDYAIPAGYVRETLARLQDDKLLSTIGINGGFVQVEDYDVSGIWVSAVTKDSLIEDIRVRPGDVITKFDGIDLGGDTGMVDYCEVLGVHSPEDVIDIQLFRASSGDVYEGQLNGRHLRLVDHLNKISDESEDALANLGGDYIDPGAEVPGEFYFRTQFIQELDNWSVFGTEGFEDTSDVIIEGGKLTFFIKNIYTYVYYTYDLLDLGDVRLEIDTSNLGRNNNNISLICRYSDLGWYEFNIANNGLWWINRFDPSSEFSYVELASGGSFDINMGQKRNHYAAICDGDQLTLLANDVELSTVRDKILTSGNVGFSFSSANVSPVVGELEYFDVSVP